jgi:hypothetical protein
MPCVVGWVVTASHSKSVFPFGQSQECVADERVADDLLLAGSRAQLSDDAVRLGAVHRLGSFDGASTHQGLYGVAVAHGAHDPWPARKEQFAGGFRVHKEIMNACDAETGKQSPVGNRSRPAHLLKKLDERRACLGA